MSDDWGQLALPTNFDCKSNLQPLSIQVFFFQVEKKNPRKSLVVSLSHLIWFLSVVLRIIIEGSLQDGFW